MGSSGRVPIGSSGFKPYIQDGKTVVISPHRVWRPPTNDLVLQLRKRGISKAILGGMLANMCVESHLRDLLEQRLKSSSQGKQRLAPDIPNGVTATRRR